MLVALRALSKDRDPAGRTLALAASGALGLWLVHGSADWLMEYGGLSAIVAAVCGIAVASPVTTERKRAKIGPLAWSGAVLALVAALWAGSQWIVQRDQANALALGASNPTQALIWAHRGQTLDLFSEISDETVGALAVARGDAPAARSAYLAAYHRSPGASAPRMWLGVLASAGGNRADAERWLHAAQQAAPRDPLIASLLQQVKTGNRLSPAQIVRRLTQESAPITRDSRSSNG